MIDDPVEDLIKFIRHWWRRLLLSFMNEEFIILRGDPMKITNQYYDLTFYYERKESEPDPVRVAQRVRRARERELKKQLPRVIELCAALLASSHRK